MAEFIICHLDIYKKDVGLKHPLVPLSRSRITSPSGQAMRTPTPNIILCSTIINMMKHGYIIPRVAFTIAFIDGDSKLRVLTVKSSVVNANNVYASYLSLQVVVQSATAKVTYFYEISYPLSSKPSRTKPHFNKFNFPISLNETFIFSLKKKERHTTKVYLSFEVVFSH